MRSPGAIASLAGRVSLAFYGGTILVGICVPLALSALRAFGPEAAWIFPLIGVTSLVGDFYVKYAIVRAGIHAPLAAVPGQALQPIA
jgi:hypothetical protein